MEVLIVDSGSTDGTQDMARSLGARVHEILPAEFNHGATRNLGAELASGEIIVFTVDDAVMLEADGIESLTAPLRDDPRLAGTFGRHLAREDAPPHQAYYIRQRYGSEPRTHSEQSAGSAPLSQVSFSNVISAVRREVLLELPFASDIVIAEDAEWCARVINAGYKVAYVPETTVRHSHEYSVRDTVKRYFDLGAAAKRSVDAGREGGSRVTGEGLRFVRGEIEWMWRSGRRSAIPAAVAHEAARYVGFQLGVHHRYVPKHLRARISRTSVYWS